jgi:hypothetical protein
MVNSDELDETNQRIGVLRDNLRNLVEQAAAYSGAADEARTADASPIWKQNWPTY